MSDFQALEQLQPVELGSPSAISEFVTRFGCKSYGLTRIPVAWRPPGLAVSVKVWRLYKELGAAGVAQFFAGQWSAISNWAEISANTAPWLLRSSGTKETVQDRGRYLSVSIDSPSPANVSQAAVNIFEQFASSSPDSEMALLIQPLKSCKLRGHASNFRRISKTKNQWQAEIEVSTLADRALTAGYTFRYNSQRHTPADPNSPLPTSKRLETLGEALKHLSSWLSENLPDVVAVEWIDDGDSFWIVQCDDEIDPPGAIDPSSLKLPASSPDNGKDSQVEPFLAYAAGQSTSVRKLLLLNDFDAPNYRINHNILYATAQNLDPFLEDQKRKTLLAEQIDQFGPQGVVVRTEITTPGSESLPNLPRTDTVRGAEAVTWLRFHAAELKQRGFASDQIHFLMHRFIPACASAWSYHEPGQRIIRVDCTWGLPDGLQFYPHDSYEFDLIEQKIIRTHARYKPYILWPNSSGKWEALNVQAKKARGQVLSGTDIATIANHTAEITKKIGAVAQVMWFCNFSPTSEYRRPLPWFRETKPIRPKILEAAPAAHALRVRSLDDLRAIKENNAGFRRIILEPDVNLIREKAFIDDVITLCRDRGYSVIFAGSILGHAFYQLAAAGVAVYSSTDSGRRRTINKHEFAKLVRDLVPNNIAARGETVRFGVVETQFKRALLLGKLIEELSELASAEDETRVEELADVYEVFRAIVHDMGIPWEQLVEAADTKRVKRGGFSNGIVLLETSLSEADDIDGIDVPTSQGSLIPEPTATAVNASLSIRSEVGQLSVPISSLLDGRTIMQKLNLSDGTSIEFQIYLDADRLVARLQLIPDAARNG